MTTSIKVAIESHPDAPVVLKVYVPAAVYSVPFQLYGNAEAQIVSVFVDVVCSFTTNTSVAIESHPAELVVVNVYVPTWV